MRSHYCGDIQSSDIGAEVEISGWVHKRRDHGGVIFLDIRDLHGIVQVVFNPESKDTFDLADSCRSEFVINIKGLVRARIEGAINPKMATVEIEIEAQSLIIYSTALTPKFPLDDYQEVNEDVRLKNRFLDLRRPDINDRLIKRSKSFVIKKLCPFFYFILFFILFRACQLVKDRIWIVNLSIHPLSSVIK